MDTVAELNGVVYGLDDSVYRQQNALSKSTLSAFSTLGDMDFDSDALRVGNLVDCMVFAPDLVKQNYCKTVVQRRGTKEWKEVEEVAQGKELIKAQEWDEAELMARCIREHAEAMEYLSGKSQVSIFWQDEETGLKLKARADSVGQHLGDLKTSVSVNALKWAKQASELKYDWQDVWYCEGLAANGIVYPQMFFVVVQKTPVRLFGTDAKRHPISIFKFDEESRKAARNEIAEWRRIYKYSIETQDYPEFPRYVQTISRPKYMMAGE